MTTRRTAHTGRDTFASYGSSVPRFLSRTPKAVARRFLVVAVSMEYLLVGEVFAPSVTDGNEVVEFKQVPLFEV
jgi:hypothetical protein